MNLLKKRQPAERKFRLYDSKLKVYLFHGKKYDNLRDAERALHEDFMLTVEQGYHIGLPDMMNIAGIEIHFDDGQIVDDYYKEVKKQMLSN